MSMAELEKEFKWVPGIADLALANLQNHLIFYNRDKKTLKSSNNQELRGRALFGGSFENKEQLKPFLCFFLSMSIILHWN